VLVRCDSVQLLTIWINDDKAHQQEPATRRDDNDGTTKLRVAIQRVWDENEEVYGPRKAWKELRREGHRVARCTVGG
jgi:hypothetical protein